MALAWSRKHAHTQARLCERFAAPVIAGPRCQGINVSHMQEIVNAAHALSAAGKGVAMRRESRRRRTVAPGHHGRAGKKKPVPAAVNRRYAVDIAADRSATIGWMSGEASRRDPGRAREWVALNSARPLRA